MPTFEWKYAVVTIRADLEDATLTVKQGIRTFQISPHQLKMLYVHEMPGGQFSELILVTEKETGKQKILRFYSDAGDPGLIQFADELVKRKPGIDLRSLSREEALGRMKAADTSKIALYALPVVLLTVMGFFFYPLLIHGLDDGSAAIQVEDLEAGRFPSTRNVIVKGRALDSGLKESKTKKGRTTTRLFFPLVGQDWSEGDVVHVLVEAPDLTDSDLTRVLERPEHRGILRNILWEGPSKDQAEFFREKYKLKISPSVILIELDADRKQDLYIFFFAYGITLAIVIGVFLFMRVKYFR